MTDKIALRKGILRRTGIGEFGVIRVDARPGHPVTVRLLVAVDEEEAKYTLQIGDSFPVQGELWVLDGVDDPAGAWLVRLRKAEQTLPG
ncbi:hypothetical protein OOK31_06920 [Streptomyces sp. NBC_00249]|uniref:DUF6406 domain-containing protein n=1 Tax=Streptomyces sp. NBC_00249 TaxID=2975690 RepID=UPI002254E090|nr:DUF6406 domain-containing protein [Streptomyces sp. NBC_00249]MCX5193625.1 hypothetical protein [Streptomyces sp. NBC_00249]